MTGPGRAELSRQPLLFGPLSIRLDPIWESVAGAVPAEPPPGSRQIVLEHGPVGPGAARLETTGGGSLRIEALGPGVVRASGPAGRVQLRAALRWTLVQGLCPLGAFLVHAAAVEVEDGAHLFFGPSGAGKTTLAAHAGSRAITEESAVVWSEAGRWFVGGTPWWSEGGRPGRMGRFELTRLGWLTQSDRDGFHPRSVARTLPRLVEQIYSPAEGGEQPPLFSLGEALLELLASVEHGELEFTRDAVYVG